MRFKKVFSVLLITLILIGTIVINVSAVGVGISGTGSAETGDTITVNIAVNGCTDVVWVNGGLSYDSSKLQLLSSYAAAGGDWTGGVDGSNTSWVVESKDLNSPINGSATVLTMTFKVLGSTNATVTATSVTITSLSKEESVGSTSYTCSVSAPQTNPGNTTPTDNNNNNNNTPDTSSKAPTAAKSSNANLASLTVGNAEISPAFSGDVTSYTASVPFEVDKLDITAKAEDSKATVSVYGNALQPNAATGVQVVVKAENGSTKTYTIETTRAQDPNYVPNANNQLAGITVDTGVLSPAFNPDITSYVVWLPYEAENIGVTAVAADAKASVTVEGGSNLKENADNPVKVICTAESKEQKVYTVIAKRAINPLDDPKMKADTVFKTAADVVAQIEKMGQKYGNGTVLAEVNGKLDAAVLQALVKYPAVILKINLNGAVMSLDGSDITGAIKQDGYSLSYRKDSDYKQNFAKASGGEVFSYTLSGSSLPGTALNEVQTSFAEGETVNIYAYHAASQQYIALAKGVTVGKNGVVSYRSGVCYDTAVTRGTIAGAIDAFAPQKAGITAFILRLPLWGKACVAAGVVLFGAVCGFLLKMLLYKRKRKLEEYNVEVPEDEENFIEPEAVFASEPAEPADNGAGQGENDFIQEQKTAKHGGNHYRK